MRRRAPKTVQVLDIENQTKRNIQTVLGGFPALTFGDESPIIAPFVNIGPERLSDLAIERRNLAAPLIGSRLVPNVSMNVSLGGGTFVDSPAVPLANILIGEHCKALVLGNTTQGNQLYLTEQGYIGESVPPTPQPTSWRNEYPLRCYQGDLRRDVIGIMAWQTNYNPGPTEEYNVFLPTVSLHPDRHLGNFPELIPNVLGHLSAQLAAIE